MQTVIGIFSNTTDAHQALSTLERMEYNPHDIAITTPSGEQYELVGSKGGRVGESTVSGVVSGAVIGGLSGIIVGLSASFVPGLQSFLLGRELAASFGLTGPSLLGFSGMLTGILLGAVVGLLIQMGTRREEAPLLEEPTSEAAFLIAVPANAGEDADRVRAVFQEYRADQVRSITSVRPAKDI